MKKSKKHILLSQLTVLWHNPGFFWAFLIMLGYAALAFIYQCYTYAGQDVSVIPDANTVVAFSSLSTWGLIEPVFCFLLALPFAVGCIQEQKSGALYLSLLRTSYSRLFFVKSLVAGLANFAIVFVPLFINFCLCNCFFPHNHNSILGIYAMPSYFQALTGTNLLYSTQTPQAPLLEVYLLSPVLYNLWHLFLLALTASVWGIWLTAFSYFVQGRTILLFLPMFLVMRVMGIFTERGFRKAMEAPQFSFTNYRLLDYCIPFSFPGKNWMYYIGFLAVLLLSTVGLYSLLIRKLQKSDVSI